jgi:hypothetical protein
MTPDIHQSFLDFYSVRSQPAWYLKEPRLWQKLQSNLTVFDATPPPSASKVSTVD